MKPISIYKIIKESHLYEHYKRGAMLQSIDQSLKEQLQSPLKDNIQLVNLHNDRATFFATSPIWASRLRYSTPTILAILEKFKITMTSPPLKSISIKVQPDLPSSSSHLAAFSDEQDVDRQKI